MDDQPKRKRLLEHFDSPFQYFKHLLSRIQTKRGKEPAKFDFENEFIFLFHFTNTMTEEEFYEVNRNVTVEQIHQRYLDVEELEKNRIENFSPPPKKLARANRKNRLQREKLATENILSPDRMSDKRKKCRDTKAQKREIQMFVLSTTVQREKGRLIKGKIPMFVLSTMLWREKDRLSKEKI